MFIRTNSPRKLYYVAIPRCQNARKTNTTGARDTHVKEYEGKLARAFNMKWPVDQPPFCER